MPSRQAIFLSAEAAVDAIGNDFLQYPSQITLLETLWPLVFGEDAYLMRDTRASSAWIKTPHDGQPRQLPIDALEEMIVRRLCRDPVSADQLARICCLVFQAPVKAGRGPGANAPIGIWVHTNMDWFVCRQCGRCCSRLTYHDGCSLDDYRRWQRLGRDDILGWVGTVHRDGRLVACRIWMQPGTNRYAPVCPWLKRTNEPQRYRCAIHNVRPAICRQYPGSRKHARMTGCRGV
jgi:hypothetical protein